MCTQSRKTAAETRTITAKFEMSPIEFQSAVIFYNIAFKVTRTSLGLVAAGRGAKRGGHPPRAALCRGRYLEGQEYGILKFGRFWRIGVCIQDGFSV